MTGNWLIITGFLLLAFGIGMRTTMMMRASDMVTPDTRALDGRGLLRQYRREFPRSATPLFARGLLIAGTVLLLAGLAMESMR